MTEIERDPKLHCRSRKLLSDKAHRTSVKGHKNKKRAWGRIRATLYMKGGDSHDPPRGHSHHRKGSGGGDGKRGGRMDRKASFAGGVGAAGNDPSTPQTTHNDGGPIKEGSGSGGAAAGPAKPPRLHGFFKSSRALVPITSVPGTDGVHQVIVVCCGRNRMLSEARGSINMLVGAAGTGPLQWDTSAQEMARRLVAMSIPGVADVAVTRQDVRYQAEYRWSICFKLHPAATSVPAIQVVNNLQGVDGCEVHVMVPTNAATREATNKSRVPLQKKRGGEGEGEGGRMNIRCLEAVGAEHFLETNAAFAEVLAKQLLAEGAEGSGGGIARGKKEEGYYKALGSDAAAALIAGGLDAEAAETAMVAAGVSSGSHGCRPEKVRQRNGNSEWYRDTAASAIDAAHSYIPTPTATPSAPMMWFCAEHLSLFAPAKNKDLDLVFGEKRKKRGRGRGRKGGVGEAGGDAEGGDEVDRGDGDGDGDNDGEDGGSDDDEEAYKPGENYVKDTTLKQLTQYNQLKGRRWQKPLTMIPRATDRDTTTPRKEEKETKGDGVEGKNGPPGGVGGGLQKGRTGSASAPNLPQQQHNAEEEKRNGKGANSTTSLRRSTSSSASKMVVTTTVVNGMKLKTGGKNASKVQKKEIIAHLQGSDFEQAASAARAAMAEHGVGDLELLDLFRASLGRLKEYVFQRSSRT